MFSSNDKISIRQLQILLILNLFGSTSLILPRTTSEIAQQNGWMLVIGSTCLTMFYCYLISTLGKMFPNQTIVEYASEILSKPVGILLSMFLGIKITIIAAFEIRLFGELVKQTLLNNTPIEYIMLIMMFTAVYLTRKGYEARARMGEIIIFLTLIPIMLVIGFAITVVKPDNLAPFLTINYTEFFKGSFWISMTMTGIELLYIAIPFVKNNKKITQSVIQCIFFVGILNLIINVITIGVFGASETAREVWPVMAIMQVIEIPGAFIARQDALMMSFWILTSFALINSYIFFVSLLTSRILKTKSFSWVNLLVIPLIYVIALIPDNVPQTFKMLKLTIQFTGIIFVLPVPILLIAVAKLRKLGGKDEQL